MTEETASPPAATGIPGDRRLRTALLCLVLLGLAGAFAGFVGVPWMVGGVIESLEAAYPAHPHGARLRSGALVGRTRAEVLATVGEPAWHRDEAQWLLDAGGPEDARAGAPAADDGPALVVRFDVEGARVARMLLRGLPRGGGAVRFTPEAWRAADAAQRRALAADLVDRRVLQGRDRAGVLALLGPPDRDDRSLTFPDGVWNEDGYRRPSAVTLVLDEADVVRDVQVE